MGKVTRVGIVLPESHYGNEEWKNSENALKYADEVARKGAQLVVFPEGYPGPATGPLHPKELSYRPIEALCEKAKERKVYIAAGDVEENPSMPETYFLSLHLISPEGKIIAKYRRLQPDTPPLNAYLYNGKAHLLPGREFVVKDTPLGKVGLQICSELWVPEICRINMLKGAEILLSPVHGLHSKTMYDPKRVRDTWRCVARARAAENSLYVVVTQNFYISKGIGLDVEIMAGAFVAGPEEMVAHTEEPGVLIADLDMGRLEYIRSRNYDEENLSKPEDGKAFKPLGCRPGQIWERNPKLYEELTKPHKYSYNYHYFDEDLDAWIKEYDKIYGGKYRRILDKYGKLRFVKH